MGVHAQPRAPSDYVPAALSLQLERRTRVCDLAMELAAEREHLHCQPDYETPRWRQRVAQTINNMFWMPFGEWLSASHHLSKRLRASCSLFCAGVLFWFNPLAKITSDIVCSSNWTLETDKIINQDIFLLSLQQQQQPQLLHNLVSDLISVFQLMECPVCMEARTFEVSSTN